MDVQDFFLKIKELEKELSLRDELIVKLRIELAARDSEIEELRKTVRELSTQLEKLNERLSQNSGNSSKPPSSDVPGSRTTKRRDSKDKKKRKRGAQRGHRGKARGLLPAEEVAQFVNIFPEQCENCWSELPQIEDAEATRYQTTEIPPIKPHTTEYRRHAVNCPCCGHRTTAPYEQRIPKVSFGPRLSSIIALLTGVYHLSRRQAKKVLADLLGVQISLGAISQIENRISAAIKPVVDEAWDQINQAKVKHIDGTSWKQCKIPLQLWTIATTMATVFKVVVDGKNDTLRKLFAKLKGILVSDRAKALNFWVMKNRQICWAHLIRKFVSFSERDGPAGSIGRTLLNYSSILFTYWHKYKDGRLSRQDFTYRMKPLQQQIETLLERAVSLNIKRLSGSCADILVHRDALWTFTEKREVEPTNNHAERELRAFVLWRKRSFGTQSDRGNTFAENIMTVAHTARKQKLDILPFLTNCCQVYQEGENVPSLFSS